MAVKDTPSLCVPWPPPPPPTYAQQWQQWCALARDASRYRGQATQGTRTLPEVQRQALEGEAVHGEHEREEQDDKYELRGGEGRRARWRIDGRHGVN